MKQKETEHESKLRKKPHGGFPPIYVKHENTESNVLREYEKVKNTVSISQIMKERRDKIPFIKL